MLSGYVENTRSYGGNVTYVRRRLLRGSERPSRARRRRRLPSSVPVRRGVAERDGRDCAGGGGVLAHGGDGEIVVGREGRLGGAEGAPVELMEEIFRREFRRAWVDGAALALLDGEALLVGLVPEVEAFVRGQDQRVIVDGVVRVEAGLGVVVVGEAVIVEDCLLYTSPSPRDQRGSRMPSSA